MSFRCFAVAGRDVAEPDVGDGFFAVLNSVRYRDSTLRIILTGRGTTVERLLLDGQEVERVSPSLEGAHVVSIVMQGSGDPAIPSAP